MDDGEIQAKIEELRGRLDELEHNRPAHGLNPAHVAEMEGIEDEIHDLMARLKGRPDRKNPYPGQH